MVYSQKAIRSAFWVSFTKTGDDYRILVKAMFLLLNLK